MIEHEQITERVKSLILKNHVSDYYVWKNAKIPNASFSMMINNKAKWKLEFLVGISKLFNEPLNWLIFGEKEHFEKELIQENKKIKEENILLREEVATYRTIKKEFLKLAPQEQTTSKKK